MAMIMLSGGFDPLHVGHLDMIAAARSYGDVAIALNSDEWLRRKKGFALFDFAERKRILSALRDVAVVFDGDDSDGTVASFIRAVRPDFFGNGGDRGPANTPEEQVCHELGVRLVYGLGIGKPNSSSVAIKRIRVPRPWGYYEVIGDGPGWRIKRLVMDPNSAMSNQYHTKRTEFIFGPGVIKVVPPGTWHKLENPSLTEVLELLEVQVGDVEESDIVRERDA